MPSQRGRMKPKYKQMAFETAVRNPDRYFGILSAVEQYEGKMLTKEFLLELMCQLYVDGVVTSPGIEIKDSTTVEDIKNKVIEVNSSRNGDGGFPKGYCSRFWTYMRTLSEFGLVYARYNEAFKISEIGHLFLKKELDDQEVFSMQAAKFNRRSPYRNVINDYNFFQLALSLILNLKERGRRLSYEQFIVLTFNKSGDLAETTNILDHNTFADEHSAYEFTRRFYGSTTKEKTVVSEYPDVVRRVMIIAGFITIRYEGKKFIEINENKINYIKDLMSIPFEVNDEEKNDAKKYFDKLGTRNEKYIALIYKYRRVDVIDGSEYTGTLLNLIREYNLDEEKIIRGINGIESRADIIGEFKEIPAPLKLEFYISILIALKYDGIFSIRPNYKADHLGKPYSHAPGNHGDIDVYSDDKYWLIEVTLIRNKTQQLNNETASLIRHLGSDEKFINHRDKYLSLVAPVIHDDTRMFMDTALVNIQEEGKYKSIKSYSFNEFISVTQEKRNLVDMEEYTNFVFDRFRTNLLKRNETHS